MGREVFDYEKFDYEGCYKEVRNAIKKPNILICGATGVGKSSLINDIFNIDERNGGAKVGNSGRPETKGIREYHTDSSTVNLFDSEGYEIDNVKSCSEDEEYYKNVITFIDKRKKENPAEMEKHIHEVWYCISAGNKRFFDIDRDLIETLKKKVPIMVLITKVDLVDEEELNALKDEISKKVPGIECYTYSTEIPEDDGEVFKTYVQKDKIVEWGINHLDESLRLGFIPAMKMGIEEKRKYIIREYLPLYAGLSVAAVAGGALVGVPFSDSVPLMGIQVKMAMSIIEAYGIKANVGKLISDVVGTSLISYLGKTLATQIVSLIPVIGTGVKVAVNASVAASVTAILGATITFVCEQYLKTCVERGGAEKIPFIEFLSKEKFERAWKHVNSNKEEFKIDKVVSSVISNKK